MPVWVVNSYTIAADAGPIESSIASAANEPSMKRMSWPPLGCMNEPAALSGSKFPDCSEDRVRRTAGLRGSRERLIRGRCLTNGQDPRQSRESVQSERHRHLSRGTIRKTRSYHHAWK